MPPDTSAISDYIHVSKYAKFRPEWGRRETYEETVSRVEDMHLRRFPALRDDIKLAFDMVREKRVLPSMRTMQFGGPAMEAVNARGFNCSATLIDRPRAFAEAFYLLLCGCGVGYSVQHEHVSKLPEIVKQTGQVVHHIIEDTIEGWGNAVEALFDASIAGLWVEFSYHLIRDKGRPLVTSGGRAPGHLPLRKALENVRDVLLGAQERRLRAFECHRMLCHLADAVLSGGIRRSAMLALFSWDDAEMMNCKADYSWFSKAPYLARANNSVALKRGVVTEKQFKYVFSMTRMYGEPGFIFINDSDHIYNPCAEAGLDPVLVEGDRRLTGWSFCNLCEINASLLTSLDDYKKAAWAATLIGTLQAAYTSMPYLGRVTETIVKRDALIGVGMTGVQDSAPVALNPEFQREVAKCVVEWNVYYAGVIGINNAARTTLLKPGGTTTLALGGAIGSGIHPHHHPKYIRRVTANVLETPFQVFRIINPGMCVVKPNGDWVIEFPVKIKDGATLRDSLSAVQFLEQVRSTQMNWVLPGTARSANGLTHSVSNTVSVRDNEWDEVADYTWANRADFTSVSFLPHDGDTLYDYAPFEAIKTEEQERRWQELHDMYLKVDYSQVHDGGDMAGENACAGGACLV